MDFFNKVKSTKKETPGFFTPFKSASDPVKVLAVSTVIAPVGGALISTAGAIGTALHGTATVTGVATCGVSSSCLGKPTRTYAQHTVESVAMIALGIVLIGAIPPLGIISLFTRTAATAAHAISKHDKPKNNAPAITENKEQPIAEPVASPRLK